MLVESNATQLLSPISALWPWWKYTVLQGWQEWTKMGLILTISSRVSGVDNTHNPPVCPIFQGFTGFGHKNTPSKAIILAWFLCHTLLRLHKIFMSSHNWHCYASSNVLGFYWWWLGGFLFLEPLSWSLPAASDTNNRGLMSVYCGGFITPFCV